MQGETAQRESCREAIHLDAGNYPLQPEATILLTLANELR